MSSVPALSSLAPRPAPRLPGAGEVPVRAPPAPRVAEPPLYKQAPLTFAIIFVNVAVFAAQIAASGLSGFAGMPSSVLHAFGGNEVAATLYEYRVETLLTSCFVHGSLIHIAFNMIALRQIGPLVERAAGAARMAPLYVLSGIAGSLGSTFFGWLSGGQRLSVGASGAICGLVGAALVIGYRIEGWQSPLMRAMARWLFALFALGLVVSLFMRLGGASGGFDNAAHAGGAVAGASIAIGWRRGVAYSRSTTAMIVLSCACICAGAGILVARYTLSNPLASMGLDDRIRYAASAIDDGRCRDARAAVLSLQRLAPRAPEVRLVERNYRNRCGR
ncbi:MAG TPA: rhomboid family intramembrane serine protease [Polyangiaceae bacterium]